MRMSRVALAGGALVVIGLIVLVAIGSHAALTPLLAIAVLVLLIGGGNLLYGKNSHGAMAQARTRPAQEAQQEGPAVWAMDRGKVQRHLPPRPRPDAACPTARMGG